MIARKLQLTVASLFCIVILAAPFSAAQGMPHAIVGYVTDSGGNAVAGAEVTLKNERTGDTLTATTSSFGQYQTDLSLLSGGYLVGDVITITAVSGSLEGSSSVTVTTSAFDQGDVVLSEETPYPINTLMISGLIVLTAIVFGLFASRKGKR